jgi:release factor glutamine methyltransferase
MSVGAEQQNWTVGSLLDWTAKYLAQKEVEFPRLDAEVLLAHALGCKRIDLYGFRHAETASADVRQRYRDLIRKRLEGCPVAYLVGRKEFFGLEFNVSPAVLIPRPDTELVVMECLRLAKPMPSPTVLDIGTGSGAIAIAVAKQHAGVRATAIDIRPDALEVAKGNAAKHGVSDRVCFLAGDLFAPLGSQEQFDFILSNPPYVAREGLQMLPPGVRDYEPHRALDGGPGGYEVLDRLVREAGEHLVPGGYLIVEIGAAQETPARQRIQACAGFELADTLHDHAGHPRVLRARWRG